MKRLRTFLAAMVGFVLAAPQASAQSMIGRVLNPDEFTDGMEVVFELRSGTTSKGHYLFPFRAGYFPQTGATVSSILEVPDSIVWTLVKSEIPNQVTGLDQYYIRNKATGLYLNVDIDAENRYAYQETDAKTFVADTASAKAFCLVSNGDATYAGKYGSVHSISSQNDWDSSTYTVAYIFPANPNGTDSPGFSRSINTGTQRGVIFLANEFEVSGFNIRYYSRWQDTNVWDIRRVIDRNENPQEALGDLADTFSASVERDYVVGTDPGFVNEAQFNEFFEAYSDALENAGSMTDEQAIAAFNRLYAAKQAIDDPSATVQIEDGGYYYIKTGYDAFYAKDNGDYAWTAPYDFKNGYAGWKKFVEGDNMFIWQVTFWPDSDKTDVQSTVNTGRMYYAFRNVGSGLYLGNGLKHVDSQPVLYTTDKEERMFASSLGGGQWNIGSKYDYYDVYPPRPFHMEGHKGGEGKQGMLVLWDDGYNSGSAWYIRKVPAEEVAKINDPDRVAYDKQRMNAFKSDALADSLLDARAKSLEMRAPSNGLITEASQMEANSNWSTNSVDFLIDGDHNTHYHSSAAAGVSLYTQDEWLQVDLKRSDLSKFVIEYWGRADGGAAHSWHDSPNKFVVTASNTPDDESSWVAVDTLDKSFPGNYDNAHYVSPVVDMKAAYRYVRLHVQSTTSGNPYWNLSELQLFPAPVEASENSYYAKNADAKAATDALDAAVATAEEHIAGLSVDGSGSEMAEINKNIAAIDQVLANFDSLQAIVDNAAEVNKNLYVVDLNKGLIKEVNTKNDGTNQLSSNCTWMGITSGNDNYSFNAAFIEDGYNLLGTLIDNDDQTYWHSTPSGFSVNVQNGYFQIDLKRNDVKNFEFMIDRRNDLYNGNHRHGVTPASAMIYATNDETLGTDVESDPASWTMIGSISGIPSSAVEGVWPYYTGVVSASEPYRFVRFRFWNSSQTYVTFSGFQVYNADDMYSPTESQYYSIDGMKDAADKMTALAASLQAKLNDKAATKADGQELQAAIDAVKALYQDRSGLESLVAKAQNLADNTNVGDEMGQLKDASVMAGLSTAIAAAKQTTSNTATFNTNKKNLEDAMEKVYDNLVQPEPGKWYYILSATAESDASPEGYYPARSKVKGAALYVLSEGKGDKELSYLAGNQLRWGMDDIKGKDRDGDIDAIWRFVPVPDSLNLGKRVYYIQNLRTGWYVGNSYGSADPYYYGNTGASFPFRVEFIGHDQFNIIPLGGKVPGVPLAFGDNARQVRGDGTAYQPDSRAAMTFEEFTDEQFEMSFDANTTKIVTLPFAITDITANSDVKAYGIHSRIDSTTIGLVAKDDIAAGEPFILVLGDSTLRTEDDARVNLTFDTPTDLSLEADTVNGLVSASNGRSVSGIGYGYIDGSQLHATREGQTLSVKPQGGFIIGGLIANLEGEPDAVLTQVGLGVLNVIKQATTSADVQGNAATVNVYTLDGVLIRKQVEVAKATQGLKKGVYIVGKSKVLVK